MGETPQLLKEDFAYVVQDIPRYECNPESGEIVDSGAFAFSSAYGLDCEKRNNIHIIDEAEKVALTTVGNVALLIQFKTLPVSVKYVFGADSSGIGSCCIHPEKTHFALGGKGKNPCIYLYEYPSLRLHRILRGGTERAYSCLAFNKQGNKLASVGAYPDFLLTVWDWPQERMILRNKAFAQDVYNVCFSPNSDGFLTTSGLGHIRFWQMASTFTGIKLQGSIGKFGKVELSDIAAYAVLPDGKVVSGSESGSLLLWEGNFIKLELRRPGELLPHEGEIHICELLDTQPTELLTAGDDGYLRWWTVATIDMAELADDASFFVLAPIKEVFITGVIPKSVAIGHNYLVVQSAQGGIHLLQDLESSKSEAQLLMGSHSGSISAVDTSPVEPFAASCGTDCSVKIWNYHTNELFMEHKFNTAGTTLRWTPKAVAPHGKSFVVGFEDGVLRILGISKEAIKLIAAHKPHNGKITAMEYSSCGRYFVTAGTDGTVFIFQIVSASEYLPLGFIEIPQQQPSRCLSWHTAGGKLLIGTMAGVVYSLQVPDDVLQTRESESYLLNLEMGVHTFSRPQKHEETEEEEGGEEKEEIPEEPIGNVTHVLHGQAPEDFYLCLDGADAGKVYECKLGISEPIRERTFGSIQPIVTSIGYSPDKSHLLVGCADGSILIQSVSTLEYFERVWIHDGKVNAANLSHDNAYLVSAGSEGGLFIHRFDAVKFSTARPPTGEETYTKSLPCDMADEEVASRFESKLTQETVENVQAFSDVEEAKDITDPKAYSIQDDKLKTEEDNRRRLAELKKGKIREEVAALQAEFRSLYEENQSDIEGQQLQESAFRIDPGIEERLTAEHKARIDEVYKEFEWDTVMLEKQLDKLKAYFLDPLLVESIEAHAFQSSTFVSSFRVRKFRKETEEALQALQEESTAGKGASGADELFESAKGSSKEPRHTNEVREGVSGQGNKKALSGWQARKEGRRMRKQKMAKLLEEKPDLNTDDPQDVAAIKEVIKNMGDYKLKSSKDYEVPEDQQITYEAKKRQHLLFEATIMQVKSAFNKRVLALRELKRRIIDRVKQDLKRVAAIDKELGTSGEEVILNACLEFKPSEWPEDRLILDPKEQGRNNARRQSVTMEEDPETGIPLIDELSKQTDELGELSSEDRAISLRLLEHERGVLLSRSQSTIEAFDGALYDVSRAKKKLECDLKLFEAKKIVLYHELAMLKEFEITDDALEQKMRSTHAQKAQALAEINACQERLSEKKAEVEIWQEKVRENMEEFHRLVGSETSIYFTPLLKLFKKKVKRQKQNDLNSEDEESEESDYDEDEDFDDEEYEEDACPEGCDAALYESVLELREKKLDQEEALAELQKSIEELKKSYDRFRGREKQINKDLANSSLEIQAFQNEKQQKLNELSTFVVLKLSQICCSDPERPDMLPESIAECLVLPTSALTRVHARIGELHEENKAKKSEYKDLHLMQKRLTRERKTREKEIEELQVRCDEFQLLKFGQVIDLDVIEKLEESNNSGDLQEKVMRREAEQRKAYASLERKINKQRNAFLEETNANTKKLEAIAALTERKRELEEELNLGIKASNSSGISRDEDRREKRRLMAIAKSQAKEIQALKADIARLSYSYPRSRSSQNQVASP